MDSQRLETLQARTGGSGCPDVTILLATYNGCDFLRAQLDSLLAQAEVAWRLVWRDDGSADGSAAVVQAFADCSAEGRCTRLIGPPGQIGVGASYATLARHVRDRSAVAFCDQDDIWLPQKLERGLAALRAGPAELPALYCARQMLVDGALQSLGASQPLHAGVADRPWLAMALTQNIATGCTVMLNAAAADLLRAAPPPPGTLHDWWCYLLVAAAEGRIVVDDEPVVLYRQHGRNVVGAPHTVWRRAIAAIRRGPAAFMGLFRANVDALLACPALTEGSRATLLAVRQGLRGGVLARLRVLRRERLRRQTRLEMALFVVWFLIG